MEHDAWFFIGIFVFIFLIWIATGGPLHPIAFTGPRLAQPDVLGGGTYLQLPRAGIGIGNSHACLSPGCPGYYSVGGTVSGGGTTAGSGVQTVPSGVPGVILTPPSPYRNMVSLGNYVSNASSTDARKEYVQIYVAQNASASVDITNWVLQSGATGRAEIIPKGTRVPTSGAVNAVDDIILRPGDRAIIVSGESPVGASFSENKCIGYFGGFQVFTPALPQTCPSAADELAASYGTPYIHDPSCIDYAKSLPRCKTAVPPSYTNLSLTCQEFLESHINYNACLTLHQNDPDFGGTTWRIYLGRKKSMWRTKYEVVELLDDRGKTVATFNY
jgi:hypothetical protein